MNAHSTSAAPHGADKIANIIQWTANPSQAAAMILQCINLLDERFEPRHKTQFEAKFNPWKNPRHSLWDKMGPPLSLPQFSDLLWNAEKHCLQLTQELSAADLTARTAPSTEQTLEWVRQYNELAAGDNLATPSQEESISSQTGTDHDNTPHTNIHPHHE